MMASLGSGGTLPYVQRDCSRLYTSLPTVQKPTFLISPRREIMNSLSLKYRSIFGLSLWRFSSPDPTNFLYLQMWLLKVKMLYPEAGEMPQLVNYLLCKH